MKKCPFCNSSNITISYDYGDYATCLVCGASGPHKDRATRANAIRFWNKRKEETMCVPEISIRPDGKGFIVRKGGIDWTIERGEGFFTAWNEGPRANCSLGFGHTIMDAVSNALENVRATESTEASVQEGKREA